ncbi:F-box domain-containing protein [Dioscorea alata]|uniref:F-box domain-containing protein n=1 Tax=Dioscorea alata TaxID=55571 RepID=A0ACB7UYZ6_DIOAL|nr:F-box domain-containing protein [Dioscorea alata]
MDYLTPLDALRIPYICHQWRSIVKREPNKVAISLVLCNPSSSISNDRIFIDLSTNMISTVNIPYLEGTCFSSKNGWLLLRSKLPAPIESSQGFYLKWKLRLFHPVSGTVIDLPGNLDRK